MNTRIERLAGSAESSPIQILRDLVSRAESRPSEARALLAVAAELASLIPDTSPEEHARASLVVWTLLDSVSAGNTRIDRAVLEAWVRRRLPPDAPAWLLDSLESAVASLQRAGLAAAESGDASPSTPIVLADGALYMQRLRRTEQRVAAQLRRRAGVTAQRPETERALSDVLSRLPERDGVPRTPSDEQLAAVRGVLGRRLGVITGGPGTGKTSVVVTLLRTALACGLDRREVLLAAPTGKAAFRLAESIGQALAAVPPARRTAVDQDLIDRPLESLTLHRALSYTPATHRCFHHAANPLPARLIVVDESSMISLEWMDLLLQAVAPDAQLVLLGDAEQLPSVEAGATFAELAPARATEPAALAGCVFRLTRSYRVDQADDDARTVLAVAETVRRGASSLGEVGARVVDRVDRLEHRAVEAVVAHGAVSAVCEAWVDRAVVGLGRLAPGRSLAADGEPERDEAVETWLRQWEQTRILCVTRVGESGVDRINRLLHQRFCLATKQRGAFVAGEPVIVCHNDYRLGLFNGDQGVVVDRIDAGERRQFVAFRRNGCIDRVSLSLLAENLELAYALSVHRAQGSEYIDVVVAAPAHDSAFWNAELVYTAVTRARRSVCFAADTGAADRVIAPGQPRSTGLGALLGA